MIVYNFEKLEDKHTFLNIAIAIEDKQFLNIFRLLKYVNMLNE